MCRAVLWGFLCHLEKTILFIPARVTLEIGFCILVQICPTDQKCNAISTFMYKLHRQNKIGGSIPTSANPREVL